MIRVAEIYGLTDPATGEVRYIGKANDARKRYAQHLHEVGRRKTPLYSWIASLLSVGLKPGLSVLCLSWDWAETERTMIAQGRADGLRLLNLADGGDQPKVTSDGLRRAAKTATMKRPKYVMQAYRLMESMIRTAKASSSDRVCQYVAVQEKFKAAVIEHRARGTLAAFDATVAARIFKEGPA